MRKSKQRIPYPLTSYLERDLGGSVYSDCPDLMKSMSLSTSQRPCRAQTGVNAKKALYITWRITPCISGDSIYSFGLVEQFSKVLDIDIITFYRESIFESDKDFPILKDKVKNIWKIDTKSSQPNFTKENRQAIINKLKQNTYDVVIFDHLRMFYMYPYVKKYTNKNCRIFLIEHNIEHTMFLSEAGYHKKNIFYKIYGNLMITKREIASWKKADYIFTISDEDKEYINNKIKKPEKVMTIKICKSYTRVKSDYTPANKLLFLGSMWWYPNIQGVIWFLEQVFNKIRTVDPSYMFYIVGDNPPENLKDLASDNIIITGKVDSVDPYIKMCDLLVVPNKVGGGAKIKIHEGIRKGIPVICSSVSSRGYDPAIFKNGFRVDEPGEFAANILRLNNDIVGKQQFIENANEIINKEIEGINQLLQGAFQP